MQATTTNLLVLEIVSGAIAGLGRWLFYFSRRLKGLASGLAKAFAVLLVSLAFLVMGWLFVAYLTGQMGSWSYNLRSPFFYLSGLMLCAILVFWFREWPGIPSTKARVMFVICPVIWIVLLGTWGNFITKSRQDFGNALEQALNAAENQKAPDFEFSDMEKNTHALSEFKGKTLWINFWATTCGPCIYEMPSLSQLQQEYADRGLVLIFLSSEDTQTLAKFFTAHDVRGIRGRVGSSADMPPFYECDKAYPISFLIDRSGTVRSAWVGAAPDSWMQQQIEKALFQGSDSQRNGK